MEILNDVRVSCRSALLLLSRNYLSMKVIYLIFLLSGHACALATVVWESKPYLYIPGYVWYIFPQIVLFLLKIKYKDQPLNFPSCWSVPQCHNILGVTGMGGLSQSNHRFKSHSECLYVALVRTFCSPGASAAVISY